MKTPGVEMRPIRQLSGSAHFNEVFFTNVRIPDSDARRSGRRRLASGADHTDERAARHARFARSRLSGAVPPGQSARTGGRPGDRQRGGAGEAGGVLCPFAGAEIHQVSRHDGAVARRHAGPEVVDHQGGGGEQAAGHPVLRPRPDRHGRPDDGRGHAGRPASSRRRCCIRRRCASPAAPTRSCATSSPNACSACRRMCGWTRTCRSARCRREAADERPRAAKLLLAAIDRGAGRIARHAPHPRAAAAPVARERVSRPHPADQSELPGDRRPALLSLDRRGRRAGGSRTGGDPRRRRRARAGGMRRAPA